MIPLRAFLIPLLAVLVLLTIGVRARAADGRMLDVKAFCAGARAIFEEAGRDRIAAERLAAARGHDAYTIAIARRLCKP